MNRRMRLFKIICIAPQCLLGIVEGVGARYCPSIEDKIVRFNDKPRHQVFLEPEGKDTEEVYVQGLSTSLPRRRATRYVTHCPGLRKSGNDA